LLTLSQRDSRTFIVKRVGLHCQKSRYYREIVLNPVVYFFEEQGLNGGEPLKKLPTLPELALALTSPTKSSEEAKSWSRPVSFTLN